MFRCKECGEELTFVNAQVDGWAKRATTFQGLINLSNDGGEPEAYLGDFEEDDGGEDYDYLDGGYDEVEEYRCPDCGYESRHLEDFVEVVDDEVELDEEGEEHLSDEEYVIVQCGVPDRVEFGPYPKYDQAKAVCDDHTSGGGFMVRLKDRHIVYIPEASARRVRRGEYPATEALLDEHGQDLDMVTVGVPKAERSEADDLNALVAGLE